MGFTPDRRVSRIMCTSESAPSRADVGLRTVVDGPATRPDACDAVVCMARVKELPSRAVITPLLARPTASNAAARRSAEVATSAADVTAGTVASGGTVMLVAA